VNAVRARSRSASSRVYGAIATKRVNAGASPTSSASDTSPYRDAASALAIAAACGSPPSAVSRAASAVVALEMSRASARSWRKRRHWSKALGCDRIRRMSAGGTRCGARSAWVTGSTASATIESGYSFSRSWVSGTAPESELSIGRTPCVPTAPATASATPRKLLTGTRSVAGNITATAASECEPSGPG
jgi:hypothetical protein